MSDDCRFCCAKLLLIQLGYPSCINILADQYSRRHHYIYKWKTYHLELITRAASFIASNYLKNGLAQDTAYHWRQEMTSSRSDEVEDLTREVINHPHFRTALEESVARRGRQRGPQREQGASTGVSTARFESAQQEFSSLFRRDRNGSSRYRPSDRGNRRSYWPHSSSRGADRLEYLQVAGCLRFRPARKK